MACKKGVSLGKRCIGRTKVRKKSGICIIKADFNSEFNNKCLDTLYISKQILKDVPNYKLGTLAEYFNISYNGAHRSLRDCEITFEVYKNLNKIYNEKNSLILN